MPASVKNAAGPIGPAQTVTKPRSIMLWMAGGSHLAADEFAFGRGERGRGALRLVGHALLLQQQMKGFIQRWLSRPAPLRRADQPHAARKSEPLPLFDRGSTQRCRETSVLC